MAEEVYVGVTRQESRGSMSLTVDVSSYQITIAALLYYLESISSVLQLSTYWKRKTLLINGLLLASIKYWKLYALYRRHNNRFIGLTPLSRKER